VKQPNLILLITDQQRAPQHWPEDPAWLDALMPNDAELRRTGMSFNRAFTASAMCSPSRASIFTGTYPSRHGVPLTLTYGDLYPDPKNARGSPHRARRRGRGWGARWSDRCSGWDRRAAMSPSWRRASRHSGRGCASSATTSC
jgi:hypothetical protein